jgi:hypothetical protein
MSPKEDATARESLWKNAENWSWPSIVVHALESLNGTASLAALCSVIERHPRVGGLKHWKAEVRKQLEQDPTNFVRVARGVWSFPRQRSAEQVDEFNRERRARHPRLDPRKQS